MADSSERAASPAAVSILSDAPLDTPDRDYFGFRVYAEAMASLIDNEVTDTPLTIAITAPWGGGKTSVARMVRRRLDERAQSRGNDRPMLACWFDAWMHNDAPHLGAALATAVARTANQARPAWKRLVRPVPTAMLSPSERWRRRVGLGIASAALAVLVILIGPLRDPVFKLLNIADTDAPEGGTLVATTLLALLVARRVFGIAENAAKFVDDPRSEAASGSMTLVKAQLGELIDDARRGGRFVIYVDDLDRCTPERALEVCEVASQVLSHEGVVAILVADMQLIAETAESRYPNADEQPGAVGRQFLEKIVQIQVALPPPDREHMRRLLRGEAPARVPAARPAMPVRPLGNSSGGSLGVAIAETVSHAAIGLVRVLTGIAVIGAVILVLTGADVSRTGAIVTATLVGLPLLVAGASVMFLRVRARRAKAQEQVVRDLIHDIPTDRRTQATLERRVLDAVDPAYHSLAMDVLQSYRVDNTPELTRVTDVIVRYPPELPRGAKRTLNHARMLTQIARDRQIFGGDPELTPEHLGEWIVLAERWPQLARRVVLNPGVIEELEDAAAEERIDAALAAQGLRLGEIPADLVDLLKREPRLSEVVARLVHLEPWRPSADAEVAGIDRRP